MKLTTFLIPFLIATGCASECSDLEMSPPNTPTRSWKLRVETDDGLVVTKEIDGSVKIVQTKHYTKIGKTPLRVGDAIQMRKEMDFGYLNPLMKDLSEREFLDVIDIYSSIREIHHIASAKL